MNAKFSKGKKLHLTNINIKSNEKDYKDKVKDILSRIKDCMNSI